MGLCTNGTGPARNLLRSIRGNANDCPDPVEAGRRRRHAAACINVFRCKGARNGHSAPLSLISEAFVGGPGLACLLAGCRARSAAQNRTTATPRRGALNQSRFPRQEGMRTAGRRRSKRPSDTSRPVVASLQGGGRAARCAAACCCCGKSTEEPSVRFNWRRVARRRRLMERQRRHDAQSGLA